MVIYSIQQPISVGHCGQPTTTSKFSWDLHISLTRPLMAMNVKRHNTLVSLIVFLNPPQHDQLYDKHEAEQEKFAAAK